MLLIPAALVFAAGVAAVAMFFRMSDTANLISGTLEVRLAASSLLSQIQDAETSERGYMLTGQDNFLEPYHAALAQIQPDLAKLRQLTLDNAEQQKALVRLRPLIQSKLAVIESIPSVPLPSTGS